MESLRRVLVAIGGLLSLAAAALAAVALIDRDFGRRAVDYLDRCLVYNLQQIFVEGRHLWQPIVFFAVMVIIAVILFIVAFKRAAKQPTSVRVKTEDDNQIEISLSAIENVVKRAAKSVPQVQELTTSLKTSGDSLDVDLNVTVPSDEALPAVGAAVRQAVTEQMTTMTGVTPRSVRVQVVKVAEKQEA